jgi:protein LTV1
MGKKKSFIDKKNSSTYHLLYRSQRDVAGEVDEGEAADSGSILWPSPDNNKETDTKVLTGKTQQQLEDENLKTWKQELAGAGLVDDYNYDKHLKPITGTGSFLDVSGKRGIDATIDPRSKAVEEEMIQEVERQLESIALTPDCMDNDIAHALFDDFEEGEFEELNDDFVFDAAKPPEEGDDADQGFDFASHVQKLMEKAKLDAEGGGLGELATVHEQAIEDQEFFSKSKALGFDDDDDEYDEDWQIEGTPGVVPKLSGAQEKALCDKFAAALLEYDSDDIGEGQDDDDIVGPLPLEGDDKVEAALDDFLQEKKDDIFMQGARHYMEGNEKGGSGFSALVGTRMIPVKQLDQMNPPLRGDIQPIEHILGEADDTLGTALAAPPTEEIFVDGKSYFSERIRNPWDCESILTTYSNLDNNPVTIGAGGRRRRKQKGNASDSSVATEGEAVQQIQLSDKTGLPLGVLPSREYESGADTYVSVNKGVPREKNETIEEKKARKQNIKKERQLARMQKKMMKEAFSEEFSKRTHEVLSDDVGGKTVFRF